jgi:hypothetical protein
MGFYPPQGKQMKVKIHGQDYEISEDDTMFFNTGNYAKHSMSKMEIIYDPGMKPSVIGEGIFHELMEATNFWCDTRLDHKDLTLISMFMFGILNDNPDIRKIMFEGKKLEDVEKLEL